MTGGTIGADSRVAFVLPVGCGITQKQIFRANHAVIVFVIDIRPPFMPALHRLWTLVSGGQHPVVVKNLLADMGRVVGGIGYNRFNFRESLRHLVIHVVEGCAVMDIAGCHHGFQNKAVFITGRVGLVGKLPLVLPLDEQATVRVRHTPGYRPSPSRRRQKRQPRRIGRWRKT